MRRRRIRGRFFVLVGLLVLVVALVLFVLSRRGAELVVGSMVLEERIQPVIVRDEQVVSVETYGKVIFDALEGEYVTPETKVAEVFKWGYNDDILKDYINKQREIKEYQVELNSGIQNVELEAFDAQIMQKTEQLVSIYKGTNKTDMLSVEREIKELLEARREYLNNNVQGDEQLTALYEQEQKLEQRLTTFSRAVKSEGLGTISFYFDGYETVYNRETLLDMTPEQVAQVLKGTGTAAVTSTNEKPFYRIVNNVQWHLAVVPDKKSDLSLVLKEQYTVLFDGYSDHPYEAWVAAINIMDSTNMVYVLQINDDLGPFIGVRHAKATIMKNIQGLKVPRRLIATVDGAKGIYIGSNENRRFVKVDVLGIDGKEAFIQAVEGEEELQVGMRVSPK